MQTSTTERTLPFDLARCDAQEPDSFCVKCLRWAHRDGQTWGERTPMFMAHSSVDERCSFIPAKGAQ